MSFPQRWGAVLGNQRTDAGDNGTQSLGIVDAQPPDCRPAQPRVP
jgi:hypothetical protein